MKIRPQNSNEETPFDLLLLADPSKEIVKEYLGRGQCLVALINEEIIGVMVLIRTRPETIEIVNIAVQEDYQGMGIGKQLIGYSIVKAREEKVKTIEIGTGNSSVNQLMLYQRCGFRITGVDRDFFVRHYEEEIYENGIQCRDMIRLSLDI
ncbi:GNAT family N-acetyltransferase [Paenibacillus sp. sgz5001063]|uniref:GNAT family N-acetyltransferase n=1 Tax=Paenibacillus sp. sgz5001063 TaxID=3242474 RepID=UPI0036D2A263